VPHDDSVRRLLPVSRLRYFVLAGLIVAAAAIVGIVVLRSRFADRAAAGADAGVTVEGAPAVIVVADAAPDPIVELLASATRLAEAGKLEAAIEVLVDARRDYPDRAVLALSAGKLYFARLWWNDGLVQLRDALRMEPTLRGDPDLIKTAIRGFLTTPGYDDRLGRFLVELGAPAAPLLDDAARTHPNPQKRARAAALLRKLR
jgi:serine/threonine-protein kinase